MCVRVCVCVCVRGPCWIGLVWLCVCVFVCLRAPAGLGWSGPLPLPHSSYCNSRPGGSRRQTWCQLQSRLDGWGWGRAQREGWPSLPGQDDLFEPQLQQLYDLGQVENLWVSFLHVQNGQNNNTRVKGRNETLQQGQTARSVRRLSWWRGG